MNDYHVLLTDTEFEDLSRQLIAELDKIPLYSVSARHKAALKYLQRVQTILIENLQQLDDAGSVNAAITVERLSQDAEAVASQTGETAPESFRSA